LFTKWLPAAPTILIQGESGTGKDLVAKAIHYRSSRAERSFVAINCSAIPETLMEAELLGYRERRVHRRQGPEEGPV
jgi:two-component system, NtrC family, response regulator AtoC